MGPCGYSKILPNLPFCGFGVHPWSISESVMTLMVANGDFPPLSSPAHLLAGLLPGRRTVSFPNHYFQYHYGPMDSFFIPRRHIHYHIVLCKNIPKFGHWEPLYAFEYFSQLAGIRHNLFFFFKCQNCERQKGESIVLGAES